MNPVAAGGVVALTPETAPPGVSIQYVRGWNACLTAAQAEADRLRLDAERWRAVIGSGRVRVLGSAGLHSDTDFYGKPRNGYAHIGLELWTKHDAGNEPSDAVEWFTKYADTAIHAAKTEQETTMELSTTATDAISQHFDDRPVNTEHPLFERIWQTIKGWDIQRVNGAGYAGANGTDVQIIIDAIEQK